MSDFIQSPAHRSLALNASLQSVVLLKNNHMFLPLQKTYSKIAVRERERSGHAFCSMGHIMYFRAMLVIH